MPARIASSSSEARRVSRATSLSVRAWWRGLRSGNGVCSRFSMDKAAKFVAYARTASTLRQMAVVLLFPLPGVIAALALPLIPLQNPTRGPLANWGSWLHIFGVNWVAMASGLVHTRAVSQVTHSDYSTRAIALVATIASVPATAFYVALGVLWRFPIPFYPAFAPFPFVLSLLLAHALVFRGGRLPRDVRTKLVLYVPSLSLQVSQLTIYPAYSALFAAATEWQQVVLVLLFPLIKFALRRAILTVSRHLRDFAQEIAFCGVEISASMYQAAIMVGTPSRLVTVTIIAIDVALNVWSIKRYMDRPSIVPSAAILATAVGILEQAETKPIADHELTAYATEKRGLVESLVAAAASKPAARGAAPSHHSPNAIVPVAHTDAHELTAHQARTVVTHALEMLQAAESVLLVEYLEVAVPVVNAIYVVVASQLPSATYNSKLRPFHADPRQLGPAAARVLLYTSLQALTLIAMCVVMRVRYRLSALTLLAFVLETHAWSLHGKLVMWLVAILAVPVIHYGVDFTFQFEYTPLPTTD